MERHCIMEKQIHSSEIKLVPIGNSKGIRIPKRLIQKYNFSSRLLIEETEHGLLLKNKEDPKLSWEETFKAMAVENEKWHEWDMTLSDGLDDETVDL